MSENKKLEKQIPGNVVSLGSHACKAEGCKAKPSRAEFCEEHFDWFKASLINKNGQRVPDFDKKFYAWSASQPQKKRVA